MQCPFYLEGSNGINYVVPEVGDSYTEASSGHVYAQRGYGFDYATPTSGALYIQGGHNFGFTDTTSGSLHVQGGGGFTDTASGSLYVRGGNSVMSSQTDNFRRGNTRDDVNSHVINDLRDQIMRLQHQIEEHETRIVRLEFENN